MENQNLITYSDRPMIDFFNHVDRVIGYRHPVVRESISGSEGEELVSITSINKSEIVAAMTSYWDINEKLLDKLEVYDPQFKSEESKANQQKAINEINRRRMMLDLIMSHMIEQEELSEEAAPQLTLTEEAA